MIIMTKKFLSKDGKMDMTPCPIINSRVFRKKWI